MRDEERDESGGRGWRIFGAGLLAVLALAFGAAGACGITFTTGAITEHLKAPQVGYDTSVLAIALPSALLGVGGFLACVWGATSLFRRRP